MYSGKESIEYLSKEILSDDSSESAHWRKYHQSFGYLNNSFKGLQGFGGNRKPRALIFRMLECLLQSKFRKMGVGDFDLIDQIAEDIAKQQNRTYDLDLLRQSLTVAFLRSRISNIIGLQSTVCVIGDGFSSMTSLLLRSQSAGRVILINLNKTLMVDLWYLRLWMGDKVFEDSVDLVTNKTQLEAALVKKNNGHVIAIQAVNQDLLQLCPVDLVINIASMQEMDLHIVHKYFSAMRAINNKKIFFYCCNRIEKNLPDGSVIRFSEYPWDVRDEIIFDELCPWHQQFYSFRPPFYRRYDGPIQHRLVNLAKL